MRIDPQIAAAHWEKAAVEQVASNLSAEGYQVNLDEKIGDYEADLVGRKAGETVVYEFKVGNWSSSRAHQAAEIRRIAVEQLGAQFRLILVPPPHQPVIEVAGLEDRLTEWLREHVPEDLEMLSSASQIEHVHDIEILELLFGPEGVKLIGEAVVDVCLQWGRGEDAAEERESFPFDFDITIRPDGTIAEVNSLEVDVSSWSGDDMQ